MAQNPDHVMRVKPSQIRAACRVLGFDPKDVATIYLEHASGVVRVIVRNGSEAPVFRDIVIRIDR